MNRYSHTSPNALIFGMKYPCNEDIQIYSNEDPQMANILIFPLKYLWDKHI